VDTSTLSAHESELAPRAAMGFQSIFAWKALPEAASVKKAVIDAHRSKHESIASS
jgi:hypothetical protein